MSKKPKTENPPTLTDSELLMQFGHHRDEHAFQQLVERHTCLVMGVCRQMSQNEQDAEDAFQATLLILARRHRHLTHVNSLSGWLYRVAYRTALRVSQKRSRRREDSLAAEPLANDAKDQTLAEIHTREVQQILHEELQQLSSHYRDAIVLCDLRQMTRAEAAVTLDSTESSVKAALARGRRQLRIRLLQRGVVLSSAIIVTQRILRSVQVPDRLVRLAIDRCVANGAALFDTPSDKHINSLTAEGDVAMFVSSKSRALAILATAAVVCVIPMILFAQVSTPSPAALQTVVKVPAVTPRDDSAADLEPVVEPHTTSANGASSTSFDVGSFVIINARGTNTFLAYNKSSGEWRRHTFPNGLKAVPVVSGRSMSSLGAVGFYLVGGPVSELVGVDDNGQFCIEKLPKPVNEKFVPAVDEGLTYYIVDGMVHAFSARTGTWDSLTAPQLREEVESSAEMQSHTLLTSNAGTLMVEFDNRISAFSIESGRWTTESLPQLP